MMMLNSHSHIDKFNVLLLSLYAYLYEIANCNYILSIIQLKLFNSLLIDFEIFNLFPLSAMHNKLLTFPTFFVFAYIPNVCKNNTLHKGTGSISIDYDGIRTKFKC
jgi:hypothetical protein